MAETNRSDRRLRALQQHLESLDRAGVTEVPRRSKRQGTSGQMSASPAAVGPARAGNLAARHSAAGSDDPAPRSEPAKPAAQPAAAGDRSTQLAAVAKTVSSCMRCEELCTTRTQTVFGVGNPHARLCFMGEAPGADEDRQGEPFVGRAGQLLTRIIEACTLRREDVYILNTLKCRPPGNRNPLPEEANNCREYLDAQLDIIRPDYICCLGAVAAQSLLQTATPISKLRGQFFDYRGIQVTCTYHPAYLLRNPGAKKDVWEDMKALMRRIGIEL